MKIPDSAKDAFKNNTQGGAAVELPYAAPAFWIVNGDQKLSALRNFQYFGGLACSEKNLQAATESWEGLTLPVPGLSPIEITDERGGNVQAYGARNLLVAALGVREYSSIKDESGQVRRVAPFTKGGRPGIQVLSVLGYKDALGNILHWAPIMITAKGYQVNHIKDGIRTWRKAIEPFVKKLVPDTNPSAISNLFWMSIGTFGNERKQELVGTADKKAITPVTVYMPDVIDEKLVESLYVGEQCAEWMSDLAFQAEEWFNVFKKPQASQPDAVTEPESPPPPEDDIPF